MKLSESQYKRLVAIMAEAYKERRGKDETLQADTKKRG